MKKAIYLDRDDTINRGYANHPDDFHLLPNAIEGLQKMQEMGFLLVVTTNQGGVGEGYLTEGTLEAIHSKMRQLLSDEGISLDWVEYAKSPTNESDHLRKPAPGMIDKVSRALGIDNRSSFMIGDRDTDILAGAAAGCCPIQIGGDHILAEYHAKDLLDAASWIEHAI